MSYSIHLAYPNSGIYYGYNIFIDANICKSVMLKYTYHIRVYFEAHSLIIIQRICVMVSCGDLANMGLHCMTNITILYMFTFCHCVYRDVYVVNIRDLRVTLS